MAATVMRMYLRVWDFGEGGTGDGSCVEVSGDGCTVVAGVAGGIGYVCGCGLVAETLTAFASGGEVVEALTTFALGDGCTEDVGDDCSVVAEFDGGTGEACGCGEAVLMLTAFASASFVSSGPGMCCG